MIMALCCLHPQRSHVCRVCQTMLIAHPMQGWKAGRDAAHAREGRCGGPQIYITFAGVWRAVLCKAAHLLRVDGNGIGAVRHGKQRREARRLCMAVAVATWTNAEAEHAHAADDPGSPPPAAASLALPCRGPVPTPTPTAVTDELACTPHPQPAPVAHTTPACNHCTYL